MLPLSMGFGQTEITPPELLPLGGYTARGGKKMDPGGNPLYARTVRFRQGDLDVAWVSVEMLTIPESLYREVNARLDPGTHLILVATHTHCAPDSQMLNDRMTFAIPGIASFRSRWLEWYADRIASGIRGVSVKPVTRISAVRTYLPLNRGRRGMAQPDRMGTLLKADERPFAFIYSAHPTLRDDKFNVTDGDWPGAVAQRWNVAVFPGPIGDVSPRARNPEAFALATSDEFRFCRETVVWSGEPIRFVASPVELGLPQPHPEFAKSNRIPEVLAKSLVEKFAPPSASVSGLFLGKLAVVGIPGEPSSRLGREMVRFGEQAGFSLVLPLSHTNGWMGYVLEPADYDRGGYEATLGFHGREAGLRLLSAVRKLFSPAAR
jgi:neutral ceramidase